MLSNLRIFACKSCNKANKEIINANFTEIICGNFHEYEFSYTEMALCQLSYISSFWTNIEQGH